MAEHLPWFPEFSSPPCQAHSATSRAAAEEIADRTATLRAKVLAHVRACGEAGATDEEMQAALPMPANTQRPRRRELQLAGLIKDSGRMRRTASGRRAVVWVAMEW